MCLSEQSELTLREHPRLTTSRLKRAGCWKEGDKLLRKIKRRYRVKIQKVSAVMTVPERIEMNKAAWDAVHDEYPPPVDTPVSVADYVAESSATQDRNGLTAQAIERFESIPVSDDFTQEVVWAHNNLDNKDASALECPSRGAWSMLLEARKDRGWFYEKLYIPVAKAMARRKPVLDGDNYMPSAQEKKSVAEMRELLSQAVAESRAMEVG